MRDFNINILYWLISRVVNGDKIVTNMLDEQIMIIDEEEEESDVEYKKVSLDYNCLFDEEQEIDNILKDILDLPAKNISEENCYRFNWQSRILVVIIIHHIFII